MPKQFAFQNIFAQGRTIKSDKGAFLPRTVLMDRLGYEFLACARIAMNKNRSVGGCDAAQPINHLMHMRTVANHTLEAEFLVEATIQLRVRTAKMLVARSVVNNRSQLLQVERF